MRRIIVILFLLLLPTLTNATNPVDVYLFVSESCPYCEQASYFVNSIQKDTPSINVHQFEVSHNSDNAMLFTKFAKAYDAFAVDVPMIFIGEKVLSGYYPDKIKAQIDKCLEKQCASPQDIFEKYLNAANESTTTHNYHRLWAIIIILCMAGAIGIYLTREQNRKL